jgi:hypothetical protein
MVLFFTSKGELRPINIGKILSDENSGQPFSDYLHVSFRSLSDPR